MTEKEFIDDFFARLGEEELCKAQEAFARSFQHKTKEKVQKLKRL